MSGGQGQVRPDLTLLAGHGRRPDLVDRRGQVCLHPDTGPSRIFEGQSRVESRWLLPTPIRSMALYAQSRRPIETVGEPPQLRPVLSKSIALCVQRGAGWRASDPPLGRRRRCGSSDRAGSASYCQAVGPAMNDDIWRSVRDTLGGRASTGAFCSEDHRA